MHQITKDSLNNVLAVHDPPCISIFLPTHRRHPENQQDPIRYRNLIRELESSLISQYPSRDVKVLLKNFQQLEQDDNFWNHRTEGLAILSSPDTFEIFELQSSVPEMLVVADSFHTKPLLRVLQAADRFQVLALNRHEARLYEGNRHALDEVELASEVPRTLESALGDELTEPHLTVSSYGGTGAGGTSMHHGHGQKKDEVQIDNERFFRVIDRAILEYHSQPSGLPLILAALPEHHAEFHKVSHNPLLISDSVAVDPWSISTDRLREEAWQLLEPHYRTQVDELKSEFNEAHAKSVGAKDLAEVGQALIAGRVRTLLVQADRQIPGRMDSATGQIELGELTDPGTDDLLDDMAELTLRAGGQVVVLPADQMPTDTGVAAIFRY
jgi:peptide subunit release factor 1 (eRF1)